MSISIFPEASVVAVGINAFATTATTANTMYQLTQSFDSGIYSITCVSGTLTTFEFYSSANSLIFASETSSGIATINLSSQASSVRFWTNTGTSIVVTITKTANALSDTFSGTVDTINATGTYTETSTSGFAYVLVGGGGAGGGGGSGSSGVENTKAGGGGGGGASGFLRTVALNGSMSVTIGAFGNGGAGGVGGNANGGAGNGGTGNTGGTTNFAGITAPGGVGGGGGGAGGGGGSGGAGGTGVTGATLTATGGAGGNSVNQSGGNVGNPSNIYGNLISNFQGDNCKGGLGGNSPGGGNLQAGSAGGAGGAGVVYVLKF